LDTIAVIETPEQIRFHHRLAGPLPRAWAYLFDLLIRGLIAVVIFFALSTWGGLEKKTFSQAAPGVILLLLFLLEWGYYVLFEGFGQGRSPGKRILGLRVVRVNGAPATFTDCVLRNLLRAGDFLPMGYVVGLTVVAFDARFRRLGDLVAGTMVVREERHAYRRPVPLQPPPQAEEMADFPARISLPRNLQEAIDSFSQRHDLGPARQIELAESIAPALARHLGMRFRDPVRFLRVLNVRLNQAPGTILRNVRAS
jgi:uncharacterized RDD family membrane protein YckC